MNSRIFIYPYSIGSKTALKLKEELEAKFIRKDKSKYKYQEGDLVVNWGCTQYPHHVWNVPMLNRIESVQKSVNKANTFDIMQDSCVRTVHHTQWLWLARELCENGNILFAHKNQCGHEGNGITTITKPEEFITAPLYTIYQEHTRQYRVHIVRDKVIYCTKTSRICEDADLYIKNEKSGWVHIHNGFETPQRVKNIALAAVAALKLDFGCVDVLHNSNKKKAFVLEVNTAPGLGPTLLKAYVNAFKGVQI